MTQKRAPVIEQEILDRVRDNQPDMGLVANRYTLILAGNLVLLEANPNKTLIVVDATAGGTAERIVELLPEAYVDDAQKFLSDGRSLLVVEVDETGDQIVPRRTNVIETRTGGGPRTQIAR